jgi:hypothetical protein
MYDYIRVLIVLNLTILEEAYMPTISSLIIATVLVGIGYLGYRTILSKSVIGPFISYAVGMACSVLVGILAGAVGKFLVWWIRGLSGYGALGFWPFALIAGGTLFYMGSDRQIDTGFKGVLTYLGRRIDHILDWKPLLSEGKHWLFPGLMGHIPVDCRIKPSTKFEATGLSNDQVRMTTIVTYQYRVTEPYIYLSASQELTTLEEVGMEEFRECIAEGQSAMLTGPAVKNPLVKTIEARMKKKAADEYGIGIFSVILEDIRLPPILEAALTKKREREADVAADQISINAFDKWIAQLSKHVSSELAAEAIQTQLGKSTSNREIRRYEGFQGIVGAFATVLNNAIEKFGKDKS